ncbi:MAG: asparagine synthase (glutamine-hydrolyzing) [Eubacteriales bacterium]|nr:asparagine synthase (glutamine-hydrolyzing) [Eubacteriales bacterium]
MCGIAGFCDFSNDYLKYADKWERVLKDMRSTIAHRGPDQDGEYLCHMVGLSQARLSIRDIQGGRQPMIRRKNDAEYAIVYNGEIYNMEELKPSLEKAGYRFETTTDTEVILYAYMEYGADFVTKLNGIFAIAIWDGKLNQLALYRDRVGVKPLFYTQCGNELVFGSEIKALFCHPNITPKADIDSFRSLFGIGPARIPGCGVFKGIYEIKPGCMCIFSAEGFKQFEYWKLIAKQHTDDYTQTVETVSYLVRDAVRRQMVSDVPVCSFLSGGVDSSIVTALASDYLQEKNCKLNTFSFDFVDNSKYFKSSSFQPEQDRPYVDRMLKAYDLNHTYLECDDSILISTLFEAVCAKDMPGMTDVDASLMYFCRLVKEHNKVALTGECADEIFGGYPWFYREEMLSADSFPWSMDLSARTVLLNDEFHSQLDIESFVRSHYEESIAQVPYLDGETAEEKQRRRVSYLNLNWFMQTLLERMDRTSMQCGLEARVPFADHRIVEYLYNVPWHMKYQNGVEKALLRDACGDLLPAELLHRKKSPYPKTYSPKYEQLLSERFLALLSNKDSRVAPFIDHRNAEQFLQSPKDYGKPWFGQLMAAPQMIAYILQIEYWMEKFDLYID